MNYQTKIYRKSDNIIEIELKNETVIVLTASEVVDLENNTLFVLNETAKELWQRIDGKSKVLDIISYLESIYEVNKDDLKNDIFELLGELIKKKLIE